MAENVLGGLLGYSNALKRRIRGLLDDPVNFLESALYDVIPRPEEAAAVDPRNLSATPFDSPYVQKTLQMGGLLGPTVWHGSPYKFMKFDSSKIGSGEGAQAYGYGHYVAENPRVADEYAGKLSDVVVDFANKAPSTAAEKRVAKAVADAAQTTQYGSRGLAAGEAFQRIAEPMRDVLYGNSFVGIKPLPPRQLKKTLVMQRAAKRLGAPSVGDAGYLYKIDLPDEAAAKMLDWDRPLREQAPELQRLAQKIGALGPDGDIGSVLGKGLYESLGDGLASPKSADLLRKLGIPGIRYLDQGSRGTGKGTYNYVVFPGNEDLLRILEINGQPVNALKGLLGQ